MKKGKFKYVLYVFIAGIMLSTAQPVLAAEPKTEEIKNIVSAEVPSSVKNAQGDRYLTGKLSTDTNNSIEDIKAHNLADSKTDNHGLRSWISFTKYEIDYNKYDNNTVEYIVIHDTGNQRAGADAMAHYQYYAGGDRDASAHYFVDCRQVVQIIDDSEGSWHSGVKYKTYATPISNHNSIGIEMCINSDGDLNETVQNTIDLAAYLLHKYDLSIDRLVRHYDANGKSCPSCLSYGNWSDWGEFQAAVKAKLATYSGHNSGSDSEPTTPVWYYNNILGSSTLSADVLAASLMNVNHDIRSDEAERIAKAYLDIGSVYGIRGDIAFFQCMWETGYLRYGGEVDPAWHNYCGLKNADGSGYAQYDTVEKGVEAHLQHLFCYAAVLPIPSGRQQLDPRFFDYLRGTVTAWEDLGGKWAVPGYDPASFSSLEAARNAHKSYGDSIVALYAAAGGTNVSTDAEPGGSTTSYWQDPIYSGECAGARSLLEKGTEGSDVSEFQGYLRTIGYDFVEVNSVFDDLTLRAVYDMQKRNSLTADGVVGEKTWSIVINTYVNVVQSGKKWVDAVTVPSLDKLKDPNDHSFSSSEQTTVPSPEVSPADNDQDGAQDDESNGPDNGSSEGSREVLLTEKTGISVTGRGLIYQGCSGDDVKAIQILLNALGYSLDTDGIFGGGTNAAVVDFQSKNGLVADGFAGSLTWAKLGSITVSVSMPDDTGSNINKPRASEQGSQSGDQNNTDNTEKPTHNISVSGRSLVCIGSEGDDVLALQRILNFFGYSVDEDGIFGSATRSAVIRFQSQHRLDADGIVGAQTWAALGNSSGTSQTEPAEQPKEQVQQTEQPAYSSSHGTVRYGSRGDDVKALQSLLNQNGASLDVDGEFGSATYTELLRFQSNHGLDADGICGPLTWSAF